MHLLAGLAKTHDLPPPLVLTVDHGLRPGSAEDARQVVRWARAAGLSAHILTWEGPHPAAGVEAAAREARYLLMGELLLRRGIASLFVGHTEDDQAETFLLRLARGSGLDGLAAMQPLAPWPLAGFESLSVRRPLLGFGREALRQYLTTLDQPWLEDPMNQDDGFDRVRMRQARDVLATLGLTPRRLAATAAHLARARAALEAAMRNLLAYATEPHEDGLLLDPAALAAVPREVGLRALAAALMTVGRAAYRPRFEALERLFDGVIVIKGAAGGSATLHGCRIGPGPRTAQMFGPGTLWVRPETGRKKGAGSAGPEADEP